MTLLERSVVINAPVENIDAYTMDARRWPEWYPGVESAEPDSVFPHVGGVAKVQYKAAGIGFELTFTSIEYEFGQSVAYQIEGMMNGTTRYVLTPEAGGIRVTGTFDYQVPGGGLGALADKLIIERMNASNLEKSLNNLKANLEG
jgi:uncharacterized membrane protein